MTAMHSSLRAALSLLLLCLLAACAGGGVGSLPAGTQAPSTSSGDTDFAGRFGFAENWTEFVAGKLWTDGDIYGRWTDQWNGYGSIGVVAGASGDALALSPSAVAPFDHSALVTTRSSVANFSATVALTTLQQLNTDPNPWEVGWVLWAFTDNTHFYAFTPQPNGWELSKEDPAYPGDQRFLVTGSTPKFPTGTTYVVQITQMGATTTVWVNGAQIVHFTDRERPYTSGAVGLYSEEAVVQYGEIAIRAGSI
jgi:hypothetical protein